MRVALTALGLVLLASTGAAAQTCYADVQEWRDTVAVCSGNRDMGNSADFTAGPNCQYTPPGWVTVNREVPCPGRWVNTTTNDATAAGTCASVGLQAAAVPGLGYTCASGERRPQVGTGYGSINYRFGQWGTHSSNTIGGNYITQMATGNAGPPSQICTEHPELCPVETVTFCYTGGPGDWDATDRAVAFYCQ